MSGDEITEVKVALARIETKLEAHFSRDDERAKRWEDHEARINALESAEDQRKGGKAMLAALMGAAAIVGGVVAKLITWGVK
jgi:septal ring factor EnvC (AmiA/AmiB activator)